MFDFLLAWQKRDLHPTNDVIIAKFEDLLHDLAHSLGLKSNTLLIIMTDLRREGYTHHQIVKDLYAIKDQ